MTMINDEDYTILGATVKFIVQADEDQRELALAIMHHMGNFSTFEGKEIPLSIEFHYDEPNDDEDDDEEENLGDVIANQFNDEGGE